MEHGKVTLVVLAITVVLAGVSGRTWSADGEVPWVKPPPTIEQLTGGKVHTGDTITAQNVELVRPYLLESFARDIMDGWAVTIAPTTPSRSVIPEAKIKATTENAGNALISPDGTVTTKDGKPWLGGFPAADPKTAIEVMANFGYCYTDQGHNTGDLFWINPQGQIYKDVVTSVGEYYMNGRACVPPLGAIPGFEGEFRRDIIVDLSPYDVKGIAVLSIIYIDQAKYPDSWGYIPVLRRVQRFSSKQRYDSVDGSDLRAGDLNSFSDPLGLWTFKLIARQPMLYPLVLADYPFPEKGKPPALVKGKYLANFKLQLRDCYLIEAVPKDPAHIYSKKIIMVDSATYIASGDFYDKQGKLWIGFHSYMQQWPDPCGNSERAIAYYFHNYQTGSETLPTIWTWTFNSPDVSRDEFTLKFISSQSR